MKKIVSLLVFTLLAVVGYYIGAAVAQNNNPAATQNPDGVMVIEEEYDVLVPEAADATSDTDTDQHAAPADDAAASKSDTDTDQHAAPADDAAASKTEAEHETSM